MVGEDLLSVLDTAQPMPLAASSCGTSEGHRRSHDPRGHDGASRSRLRAACSIWREHALRPCYRVRRATREGSVQVPKAPKWSSRLERVQQLRTSPRPSREKPRLHRGRFTSACIAQRQAACTCYRWPTCRFGGWELSEWTHAKQSAKGNSLCSGLRDRAREYPPRRSNRWGQTLAVRDVTQTLAVRDVTQTLDVRDVTLKT